MKSRVVNIKIPAEIKRSVEAESAARSLTIGELVSEALLAKYANTATARVEQLLYEAVRDPSPPCGCCRTTPRAARRQRS